MTSPAEVANDLRARARQFRGHHLNGVMLDTYADAMLRGAKAIDQLLVVVNELEAAAQFEADRFERYFNGDDLRDQGGGQ